MNSVTVAIPVRDGGEPLARTLAAVSAQTVAHELLVCDSGSRDGSSRVARAHGARVLEIPAGAFNHGGTRNLLLREARGTHVALLTQDAEPADERWLERLLGGFELAGDVAIVYGPYLPRPDASVAVRLELERWFSSLSPDGGPRVERLSARERALTAAELLGRSGAQSPGGGDAQLFGRDDAQLLGRRGFFTDANACLARSAWERTPFREVPYAEDRVLAIDMLRAGHAKAFVPGAAVLHSHDYSSGEQLRRCFDEWRALREVYGWREPAAPGQLARRLRGELAAARRSPLVARASRGRRLATLAAVGRHHVVRLAGAVLGSRADALPPWARQRLSLEGRASFVALDLDAPAPSTDPVRPTTPVRPRTTTPDNPGKDPDR
jgi:GT2 family glycosyltransferase